MNISARPWPLTMAMAMVSFLLLGATPADSFQIPTNSYPKSVLTRNNRRCCSEPKRSLLESPLSQRTSSPTVALKSAPSDGGDAVEESFDGGGILGILASVVVLYSEFVLKNTGCGLPAGPFGIVGAVEGVSYLGVVATCAFAVVEGVSGEDATATTTTTRKIATALAGLAAVVGILVLASQVTNYGYIPNAVPMEGGMCE